VPESDVEIVRRAFEAFSRSDFESALAVMSSEIRIYPQPDEPGVEECYEGWDELFDYLVNWFSAWEDSTAELERVLDAGEYVIVDAREVGVAEQSGIRVEETFAHAFKLRGGKIIEWRMFRRVETAFAELGIAPPSGLS